MSGIAEIEGGISEEENVSDGNLIKRLDNGLAAQSLNENIAHVSNGC